MSTPQQEMVKLRLMYVAGYSVAIGVFAWAAGLMFAFEHHLI